MPKHISGNSNSEVFGSIDLGNHGASTVDNVFILPIADALPTVSIENGQMCYIAKSGTLAVSQNNKWKVSYGRFFPSQLNGLAFHLDVQEESSQSGYSDGTTISGATDLSPSGFPIQASGTSSNWPTFASGGINNNPSFTFDGGDYLRVDQASRLWNTNHTGDDTEYTIFMVVKTDVDDSNDRDIFSAGSFNVNLYFNAHQKRENGKWTMAKQGLADGGGNGNEFLGASVNGNLQPTYLTMVSSGATAGIRESGVLQSSTGTWDSIRDVFTNTCLIGAIDRQSGGVQRFFDGEIGEIIVYNRALSQTDIERVESYIVDRWGF